MKKKTWAEQELTSEQIQWASENKDHPQVRHMLTTVSMYSTQGIPTNMSNAQADEHIRQAFRDFRTWWEKTNGGK